MAAFLPLSRGGLVVMVGAHADVTPGVEVRGEGAQHLVRAPDGVGAEHEVKRRRRGRRG
jgi:hypothetical protein